MIYLRQGRQDLNSICKEWDKFLCNYLFSDHILHANGKRSPKRTPYFLKMVNNIIDSYNHNKNLYNEYVDAQKLLYNFKCNFHQIVSANEKELHKNIKRFYPNGTPQNTLFQKQMINLYKEFTKEYAYYFFKKLNIRTCPYCNRTYTFTCNDKIKTRPEFDHFYDKAEYPMLALSFYNLVPSCKICNQVKHNKQIELNPYFHGFKSKFRIADKNNNVMYGGELLNINNEEDFKVIFNHPNNIEESNIRGLGLEQLYNMHKDYVLEIIERAASYNDAYKSSLLDDFQHSDHTLMDIHDFVWGKYLDVAEQEKRPLSKLTKDILDQMGID